MLGRFVVAASVVAELKAAAEQQMIRRADFIQAIPRSNPYPGVNFSWSSPSGLKQSFQLSDRAGVFWIIRQIRQLVRVLLVVVKFDATFSIVPFRVTPTVRAQRPPHEPVGRIAALDLRVGGTVPTPFGIVQQRSEACARKVFRRGQAAQVGDG